MVERINQAPIKKQVEDGEMILLPSRSHCKQRSTKNDQNSTKHTFRKKIYNYNHKNNMYF